MCAELTPPGTPHAKRGSPKRRYPEGILNRAENLPDVAVKFAREGGELIVSRSFRNCRCAR